MILLEERVSPSNLWNHPFKKWLSPWRGTEPKVNLPKAFMSQDPTERGGELSANSMSRERERERETVCVYVCPRAPARTRGKRCQLCSPRPQTLPKTCTKAEFQTTLYAPGTEGRGGHRERKRGGRQRAVKTAKGEGEKENQR